MISIKRPLGKGRIRQYDRHMSYEELLAILTYFKEKQDYQMFALILTQMGLTLRVSEVIAINIKDFNQNFNKILIRLAKTDEIREKVVPKALVKVLIAYCKIYYKEILARDGYLFHSFNPRCQTKHISKQLVYLKLRQAVEDLGIKDKLDETQKNRVYRIGSHSIRRLSITRLLQQTKDIFFVKEWVGHKDIKETMKYANMADFMKKEHQEVNNFFDNLINPKIEFN